MRRREHAPLARRQLSKPLCARSAPAQNQVLLGPLQTRERSRQKQRIPPNARCIADEARVQRNQGGYLGYCDLRFCALTLISGRLYGGASMRMIFPSPRSISRERIRNS